MLEGYQKRKFAGVSFAAFSLLFALALIFFLPSQAPAAPTIAWFPSSISETTSAGSTKTINISFTSSENISGASLRVVPELIPYVRVTPSTFANITKGQTVNFDLTIIIPPTTIPGTFEGTVQLRTTAKNAAVVAKPLSVNLNIIWAAFQDPNTGVNFNYPDFGQPSQVKVVTIDSGGTRFDVDLPSQSDGTPTVQFGILVFSNQNNLSLQDWFIQNVDPSGVLLTTNTFRRETLSNGIEALILSGPIPSQYEDGPVATIYARSLTGKNIILLNQSQDNDLEFYGLSAEDQLQYLKAVAGTLIVP